MAREDTHPLEQAHSAAQAQGSAVVYVVCGWQGCVRRRQIPRSEWGLELARREAQQPGPPVVLGALTPVD